MSDSVRPHRRQPTRLPRPWDSPGKNTGVGCHFLLQCMKVKSQSEAAQSCPTLATPWTAAHQAPPSMGFSRQKYWMGNTSVDQSESESHSIMIYTLRPCGLCSPWYSPGQSAGVGSLFLLWGIFPAQGSNPGLSHCSWSLYQAELPGKPV